MAGLIVRWNYEKPGGKAHKANLVHYMATRPGVDNDKVGYRPTPVSKEQQKLIDTLAQTFPQTKHLPEYESFTIEKSSESATRFLMAADNQLGVESPDRGKYVRYMAMRPGAEMRGPHGLFSDMPNAVNLQDAMKEVSNHNGNVFSCVISMSQEDADDLGMNNSEAWQKMVCTHINDFAKALGVSRNDLHWYGAFHHKEGHPHVHMVLYSSGQTKPFLSKVGMDKLRAQLTNDVFKTRLNPLYEQKDSMRNALLEESQKEMNALVASIAKAKPTNPQLMESLQRLADAVPNMKGRKVYKLLSPENKRLVDAVIDELEKEPPVKECYGKWFAIKSRLKSFYSEQDEQQPPLSACKDLEQLRGKVIKAAIALAEPEAERPKEKAEEAEPEVANTTGKTNSDSQEIEPQKQADTRRNNRKMKKTYHTAQNLIRGLGRMFRDTTPHRNRKAIRKVPQHMSEDLRNTRIALGHAEDDHEMSY